MDDAYAERFGRTVGIMTAAQMERVRSAAVGVAGLGMGGSSFVNLVRLGIERFHVADPDVYERTNINRQRAARESTLQRRKDDCLVSEARDINPSVDVEVFPAGVQADNVDAFLRGLDLVVDTIDVYAMDCKLLLLERARAQGIPVLSCATLGHGAVVMAFDASTPSFGELSGITAESSRGEALERFVTLMMPEVPDYMLEQAQRAMEGRGHIPFVVTGVEFAAAIVGVQVINHLLGVGARPMAPSGIFCEPVSLRLEQFTSRAVVRA